MGSPWPELERFALDFPITPDMDQFLYKHVPWLVHAIRELKSWRDTHGAGSVPKDRTEQQAYRTQLRKLYRDMQEENIDQLVEKRTMRGHRARSAATCRPSTATPRPRSMPRHAPSGAPQLAFRSIVRVVVLICLSVCLCAGLLRVR